MATVFVPSCNNKLLYAQSVKRLGEYLLERGAVDSIGGCCKPGRTGHGSVAEASKLVVVCNSCQAILEESQPSTPLVHALEIILNDEAFPYPDYEGEEITVQDCWRARGRHALHDAVRELLRRMNMIPVELRESRDDSRFCGTTTLMAMPEQNKKLAPRRFGCADDGLFVPLDSIERRRLMREHVEGIPTQRVVSYCFGCDAGLTLGGAESASIINLLFDTKVYEEPLARI